MTFLPRLRPLLEHLALALCDLRADLVELQVRLGAVQRGGRHLVPVAEGALQPTELLPLLSLLLVVLGGQLAAQDQDWEEEGVRGGCAA